MKRGPFSQEQITRILQTAEVSEQTISQICREHGITEPTFYRWRNKFSGLKTDDALRLKTLAQENARLKTLAQENARLKTLAQENARLKRLLAERDLEVDALQTFLQKK